ncbi:BZ3500_MvSof-1268-A1-R1_Chr1-3g01889 [Microbotryum saponariae]|uniref:Pyridoxal phosphate homeostasis protein n=1 Tax=Microbotryum saponariae TaxID=289078 RepID=A0A2X0MQW0_9BASI|nr:BZ3500_MvSof-1268-A1-R1_Chr1-3g01889 [Microbotryum saponariae]SCZ94834.1 BZ3501_MvSof-1269-A2-R1_Chr1-3g01491 [Microbotryum saponariae]
MQRTLVRALQHTSKRSAQRKSITVARAPNMTIQPASDERAQELRHNYNTIRDELNQAAQSREEGDKARDNFKRCMECPTLVAVSKLKPSSDILALYDHGVRHFGENYPQELVDKAKELPSDIRFHFIGSLQSNKAKMLACTFPHVLPETSPYPTLIPVWSPQTWPLAVPNLAVVETLTSTKAATALSKTRQALAPPVPEPLAVYLQINTSGEASKSGLAPLSLSSSTDEANKTGELIDLAKHVLSECPGLRLEGLMTIGSIDASHQAGEEGQENPNFTLLRKTRDDLLLALRGVEGEGAKELVEGRRKLRLSMGMSDDFVQAIKQGSNNVRVGSRIFGARPPKNS